MERFYPKSRGEYDHTHPHVNNTTNICTKQRFGHAKFMKIIEENYLLFLHDTEFICTAFRNPHNQPKDLPALGRLVELLKRKYANSLKGAYAEIINFHIEALQNELADMSIKFYKYYFHEVEKPVIIEAITKEAANYALEQLMPQLEAKGYKLKNLADMRVETPIVGVSKKKHNGKNFVWTPEGWIEDRV
jgi:hypothetical protein